MGFGTLNRRPLGRVVRDDRTIAKFDIETLPAVIPLRFDLEADSD